MPLAHGWRGQRHPSLGRRRRQSAAAGIHRWPVAARHAVQRPLAARHTEGPGCATKVGFPRLPYLLPVAVSHTTRHTCCCISHYTPQLQLYLTLHATLAAVSHTTRPSCSCISHYTPHLLLYLTLHAPVVQCRGQLPSECPVAAGRRGHERRSGVADRRFSPTRWHLPYPYPGDVRNTAMTSSRSSVTSIPRPW